MEYERIGRGSGGQLGFSSSRVEALALDTTEGGGSPLALCEQVEKKRERPTFELDCSH